MMTKALSCLILLLISASAFAGGFGELQDAVPGTLRERIPVFEASKAAPAGLKQYDYNFRCLAGPQTPQYIAPTCYLYTSRGQQACVNAGCSWTFGGTPMPDYSFRCVAASYTPQYIRPTCYLYTGQGQQACVNAGCAWGMGANPLPAFHCAAASFTPQYVAPTCYLYTGRGQQACVNAGCSWTYGARSGKAAPETSLPYTPGPLNEYRLVCQAGPDTPQAVAPTCLSRTPKGEQACVNAGCSWGIYGDFKKTNNQQNLALRKIRLNGIQSDMDDTLIAKVAREPGIDTIVKELTEGGFRVRALGDNSGGYLVSADVTGMDAGSEAIGLAKYYYVTEVLVSRKVYDSIFSAPR